MVGASEPRGRQTRMMLEANELVPISIERPARSVRVHGQVPVRASPDR